MSVQPNPNPESNLKNRMLIDFRYPIFNISISVRWHCLFLVAIWLGPSLCQAQSQPPNILLIMADDLGYSDLGCYGSEIKTPNLDELAAGGIRFSQFYNTGRCWPTRASLLTGFYPHGIRRDKLDGVRSGNGGKRPEWAPLIVEELHAKGYRNYHTGKWHLDGMPIASGFDRSYYLKDQHRFFNPTQHWIDDRPLPPVPKGTDYYATRVLGDHVLECIDDHFKSYPESPFFQYLAFAAPHFPLQALPEDIDRYRNLYEEGWEAVREKRWERIQQLGLVNGELSSPMPNVGPPYYFPDAIEQLGDDEVDRPLEWDSLTQSQRKFQANKMAIHAAMIDCMDQQIGRILRCLNDHRQLDNTVIFFLSDNGASAEMMVRGDGHDPNAAMGSADSHLCLGPGWSTTANTPFRYHKTWTHEGGTATPLIIHWKRGIQARGVIRHQVGHVIDLWPTLMEIVNGKDRASDSSKHPRPGKSLVPYFDRSSTNARSVWWLHEGNRAMREGDWKIAAVAKTDDWELYNLASDRTETQNLAKERPEVVKELNDAWTRILGEQKEWAIE